MKPKNTFPVIAGILTIFILSLALPSCAIFHAKKIETQRRGLMLQDKSQYSRNKGHYKGSKKHKSKSMRRR